VASRVSGGLVALIAGLCAVMVGVGIGIGALVWAGDDSTDDESSQPAEAQANVAEDDDVGATPDALQLSVYPPAAGAHVTFDVVPTVYVPEGCFEEDASRVPNRSLAPGDVGRYELTVTPKSGSRCDVSSTQEWVFRRNVEGRYQSAYFVLSRVRGTLVGRCGPSNAALSCSEPTGGSPAVEIRVRFHPDEPR
jgi:hypothetical protein